MDHQTAAQMKASERYVLGDLSSAERDEFEEHFSGCSVCLDEVWTASTFGANARAVFRDRAAGRPSAEPGRRALWLFRWPVVVPAFAALGLAVLAIYQDTVTIPTLRAPQAFPAAVILDGATRGSLPQVPAGEPLRFQLSLNEQAPPPSRPGDRAWVEVKTDSGRVLSKGAVKLPNHNEPLDVYVPLHLRPGRYALVVETAQAGGAELASDGFEVTPERR